MSSKEITSVVRLVGMIVGLFLLMLGVTRFFLFQKSDLLPLVIGGGCLIACALWWLSERRENESTKSTD